MSDSISTTPAPRSLLVRALLMILMCVAFHVAAWLLVFAAVLQLVLAASTGEPNANLRTFGRSVGRYFSQIAAFVTFSTEETPFPFSNWPAGD